MEPVAGPFFVFSDDAYLHASLADAFTFHECWQTMESLVAFDRDGNAFEIAPTAGATWVRLPGNRAHELRRLLRHHVLLLAIHRPDLLQMGKWEVKRAPDAEIFRLAVRWFSNAIPPPRKHWWQFWRPQAAPLGPADRAGEPTDAVDRPASRR